MSEKTVTVRIKKGKTHHHRGVELHGGDEFETEQSRAEWLEQIGTIEPLAKKPRSKKKADKDEPAAEEGGEASAEAPITEAD